MNQIKVFRPINLAMILLISIVFGSLGDYFTEICGRGDSDAMLLSILYGLIAVMVAAGGYLINDLYDVKIDAINHPDRKFPFTPKNGKVIYGVINITAVMLSLFIFETEFAIVFFIFPIWLLWLYSFLLKRWAIIGNLLVSFLALLLPLGVFLLFVDPIFIKDNESIRMQFVLLMFGATFLSTFSREIIKDIQDVKGDEANNCKTFPVLAGKNFAALVAAFVLVILLLVWGNFSWKNMEKFTFSSQVLFILTKVLLGLSLIFLFVGSTWDIRTKRSSLLIKLSMLSALITALLF